MPIAAFDTLAFTETPKEANAFSDEQAKAQVNLVHRMVGFNMAFTLAMFWKMFIA